jgi:esterase/lipase
MSRFLLVLGLPLTALLLACGGDGGSDDAASINGAASSPVAEATAQPAAAEDKPTEEPAPAGVADEPVRFETSDGVTIVGHVYSTSGPKRKAVVLAHEFPRDQTAWTDFAKKLAETGIDALTLDFRGYGETGGEKDISKIDLDLEAAARFIASRDYAQVFVFGASMGGTATLKVAARLDLAGIVTISSPHMIMGLDASNDVANISEPKLFVAARDDAGGVYVQLIDTYMQLASDPKDSMIYEGSEHGTDILLGASGAELEALLFAFLDEN